MATTSDGHTAPPRGQASLTQVLVGGAVLLLAGLALALSGAGPGAPIAVELPGTGDPGASDESVTVTTAASDAAVDPEVLPVAVRGPSRLLPGRPAPLEVRVTTSAATLGADQRRLLLHLDLDLAPDARGWLVVDPPRLLTSPAELAGEQVTLTGLDGLPCGTSPGTLTVTARELVTDGREGSVDYELPGLACPDDDLPEAPESLYLEQRVWHDGQNDWRAQVARLLAPAPTPSAPPAPRAGGGGGGASPAPAPAPAPSPSTTDDEKPDDDGGTEDATRDTADEDPRGDDAGGDEEPSGGDTGDGDGSGGGGDGGSPDPAPSDPDEGGNGASAPDGDDDEPADD